MTHDHPEHAAPAGETPPDPNGPDEAVEEQGTEVTPPTTVTDPDPDDTTDLPPTTDDEGADDAEA